MLLILGTGLLLTLMGRMFFMQGPKVANPQLIRAGQFVQKARRAQLIDATHSANFSAGV